jgi:hypothetical protein
MIDLDDPDTVQPLHSGCALVIVTIGPDGAPHATRGWGLTVVDAASGLLRVLVQTDDTLTLENIRAGAAVAVTATSVPTFRSVQLKGRGHSVEEPTPQDRERQTDYTRQLVEDIRVTDGHAVDVLERWGRREAVPCLIEVDTSFDQTPGPGAGTAIARRDR